MLVILGLILLPSREMPELGTKLISPDKLAHTFVFAVLALLMVIGFSKQTVYRKLRNKAARYALVLSIAYASLLEFGQIFSDGRMVDGYDAIANTTGCFIGYGLFFAIYKW